MESRNPEKRSNEHFPFQKQMVVSQMEIDTVINNADSASELLLVEY